jgi:hypothetical protein
MPRAATAEKRQPDLDLPEHPLPPERHAPVPPVPLRRPIGEPPPMGRGGKELRNVLSRNSEMPEALRESDNVPPAYPPPPIAELDRGQRFRGRQEERFQERAEERVQDRTLDRAQDRSAPDRPPVHRSELRMPEPEAPAKDAFEPEHEAYSRNDFSEPMLESSFVLDDAHPGSGMPRHVPAPPEEESRFDRIAARAREWLTWRPSRELLRGISAGAAALAALGILAWQWPNMVDLYRGMRAPPAETARETPAPATRSKITDRIEPGTQSASAPLPGTQAGAAVAQKVVLYDEDPSDPNGKRFVGSASWRTDDPARAAAGIGDLRDVELAGARACHDWSLRRNTDKTLPASHTVEIIFGCRRNFPAAFPTFRHSDEAGGTDARHAARWTCSEGDERILFLIGLSSVDADKERNLQLLKDRAWFDIPVVYNNNRRAILAMEKARRASVFAAFKVWKQ